MEDRSANPHPTPELRRRAKRALVECSVWLAIGFIGACGLPAGLLQLFDREVKPLSALALAVGGGVSAAISWWRGWTVLEIADEDATVTSGASSLAVAASGGSALRPASMPGGRRTVADGAPRFVAALPEGSS